MHVRVVVAQLMAAEPVRLDRSGRKPGAGTTVPSTR